MINLDKKTLGKIKEDIDKKHFEDHPLQETFIIENPGEEVLYDTVSGKWRVMNIGCILNDLGFEKSL